MMAPPTPTTTPMMVFLVFELMPLDDDEPLFEREAGLVMTDVLVELTFDAVVYMLPPLVTTTEVVITCTL